jgi:hypothetical protein
VIETELEGVHFASFFVMAKTTTDCGRTLIGGGVVLPIWRLVFAIAFLLTTATPRQQKWYVSFRFFLLSSFPHFQGLCGKGAVCWQILSDVADI